MLMRSTPNTQPFPITLGKRHYIHIEDSYVTLTSGPFGRVLLTVVAGPFSEKLQLFIGSRLHNPTTPLNPRMYLHLPRRRITPKPRFTAERVRGPESFISATHERAIPPLLARHPTITSSPGCASSTIHGFAYLSVSLLAVASGEVDLELG